MNNENFNELYAFIIVAKAGSFTKGAAQLGVSPSALSHSIKSLETRLGVRLLTRTTRSLSTTEAGEQLLSNIEPLFANITDEIASLASFQEQPKGIIRINASEYASNHLIYPKLTPLIKDYPDIKFEIHINNGWADIVAQRFDMGVRLGNDVEKDMIATRISPDMQMALIGSKDYFTKHQPPQTLSDISAHQSIGLRISAAHNRCMAWEFSENGRLVSLSLDHQLIFNHNTLVHKAVCDGLGLTWLPLDLVKDDIENGKLIAVLPQYQITYMGHHLYYPSRKQNSPLFKLVIETLRYNHKK